MKNIRKRLRGTCARQLMRAERVIKAWNEQSPLDCDIYMGRDENGLPRLMEQVFPSVREQLKKFVSHVVLGREMVFRFDKLNLDDEHVIQFSIQQPEYVDVDVITQRDIDIVEKADKNVVIVKRPTSIHEN